jgi:hypothetical protein
MKSRDYEDGHGVGMMRVEMKNRDYTSGNEEWV